MTPLPTFLPPLQNETARIDFGVEMFGEQPFTIPCSGFVVIKRGSWDRWWDPFFGGGDQLVGVAVHGGQHAFSCRRETEQFCDFRHFRDQGVDVDGIDSQWNGIQD